MCVCVVCSVCVCVGVCVGMCVCSVCVCVCGAQLLRMNELMKIYMWRIKQTSTQNLACLQCQIHTVHACKHLQAKTTNRPNRVQTAPTHQLLPKVQTYIVQLYCYMSDQCMWYFYSCEVSNPVCDNNNNNIT